MAEREFYIFVDESGNNQLNSSIPGVSNLFILVAIIVDDRQKVTAEKQLDFISGDYFSGAEIKSSKIAGNNTRRLRLLKAIEDIDFKYYALIVNKDHIDIDSGYKWKQSFYKATRSRIYKKLTSLSCDTCFIFSHRIGSQEYMNSFGPYLEEKGITQLNLFSPTPRISHLFIEGKNSRLIQLADLIAGTLSYCFDTNKTNDFSPEFRGILSHKEFTAPEVWPLMYDVVRQPDISDGISEIMYNKLLDKVTRYLSQLRNSSNDEDKMRECVLEQLSYNRLYKDSKDQAIYSDRLIDMLADNGYEKLTKQLFTSNIIGKIRDAGIIIAGTNLGYKLALSINDVQDYLAHNKSVIYPMFMRIKKAQETIRILTSNQFDILQNDKLLDRIIEEYCNCKIELETEHYERENYQDIDT